MSFLVLYAVNFPEGQPAVQVPHWKHISRLEPPFAAISAVNSGTGVAIVLP
jgi:hypothetical protein